MNLLSWLALLISIIGLCISLYFLGYGNGYREGHFRGRIENMFEETGETEEVEKHD